ncbi:hypothetical protein NQ318_008978 [Aromia moschata]|uniref:Period circadian protein n=1 Tax=Aromia moschata TaxID=1265417 RepID=A0AAV8ZD61_9CUCU|nr:hypothetical protein NQ318_008978 [Aromia moschata]
MSLDWIMLKPRRLELRRPNSGFSLYNATGSNMSASRGAVNSSVPWLLRASWRRTDLIPRYRTSSVSLVLDFLELPRPSEVVKHEVSKRCKDLANFMESLMEEGNDPNLQLDLPPAIDPTVSERDSMMLGEISPHHDYYDSKSSSETPPSYNQLNYHENIQRFFQSKPKTTVSDESNGGLQSNDTDQEEKPVQDCPNNQKCLSPIQNCGTSGTGSAESSVSNPNMESGTTSGTNTSNDSFKPPHLTESLLFKHNEYMEKIMIKKHREHRSNTKEKEGKKNHHKMERTNNADRGDLEKNEQILANYTHGIKRCGSYSREGDNHKVSKHKHQTGISNQKENGGLTKINVPNVPPPTNMAESDNIYQSGINDVNLWPPFSVTVTLMNDTQTCSMNTTAPSATSYTPGMLPIYYIPTPQQRTLSGPYNNLVGADMNMSRYQVQYMPGMIYNYNNALYPTSPIICPTLPIVSVPVVPPTIPDSRPIASLQQPVSSIPNGTPVHTDHKPNTATITPQFQRPASQATSVKAEPGSVMGSIASASVANKALSVCSREELGWQSVCSPDSPLVSPAVCETEMEGFIPNPNKIKEGAEMKKELSPRLCNNNNNIDEESSWYSSSYSSFLKNDTGSGSNDDYNAVENKTNRSDNNESKQRKSYPCRKKDPPWVESVAVSPDLIYRYQMTVKDLKDILKADLNILRKTNQPELVNDQLTQLYVDMELEGLSHKLTLEEGITSSSSSDDNSTNISKPKKKRKPYSSLVMIYEENAPIPSPITDS